MNLEVTLCGEGVFHAVTCSHPGGVLDFGYVLPKDRTSQVFQVSSRVLLRKREQSRPVMMITTSVSGHMVLENMAITILSIMFEYYFNATKNVFSWRTTRRWQWILGRTWLAYIPAGLRTKLTR